MRIKSLVLIFGTLTFLGCSDQQDRKNQKKIAQLKMELALAKSELSRANAKLKSFSVELTEIENTAENRFIRAQKLLSENNLQDAKIEFQGIVDDFQGTEEATNASKEIAKIDKALKQNKIDAEKKSALGFKALKSVSTVKLENLSIEFERIRTARKWSFDDYGSDSRSRDAEKGNRHILARVLITSDNKNPFLPPVMAYKMNNGELKLLGILGYEFSRWDDYDSFLGKNTDAGNDFSKAKTVPFNLGLQVSKDQLSGETVYIVLKKSGCFERKKKTSGNPAIYYSETICSVKEILSIEDFNKDYVLLKKL